MNDAVQVQVTLSESEFEVLRMTLGEIEGDGFWRSGDAVFKSLCQKVGAY